MHAIWIILIIVVCTFVATAAWAGFRAAPWVPTWQKDFPRIVELARVQPGDTVFELGAGEGRILLAFAKTPARSIIGYEISLLPFLVAWLRIRTLRPRVQVRLQDFFNTPLSKVQVIFCFLTPPAMKKLKPKLVAECQPGTRVISYAFAIPEWRPDQTSKPTPQDMAIYHYTVGRT